MATSLPRSLAASFTKRRWIWWLGITIWAGTLFVLSANKMPEAGPSFAHKDKVVHCLYFSGGSFCFLLGLLGGSAKLQGWRFALWGLIFTGTVGALDEFHQTFTPGRSGNDPWDWLADISGGLLGAWLALSLLRWVRPADELRDSKS